MQEWKNDGPNSMIGKLRDRAKSRHVCAPFAFSFFLPSDQSLSTLFGPLFSSPAFSIVSSMEDGEYWRQRSRFGTPPEVTRSF